jgi:hypothetical protein
MSYLIAGRDALWTSLIVMRNALTVVIVTYLIASQTAYTVGRGVDRDDFVATIWHPAQRVLDGATPYPDPSLPGFAAESVYPPLIFLLALPLALLGFSLASAAWTTLLALSAIATLWVLGVRDWRLYGLYVASCPIFLGLLWGNVTVFVTLLVALAWAYRDRAAWAGLFVAFAVAIKLLVAPLWLWFLFTRRYRAAVVSAAATAVLILVPWAVLGFDGLTSYPKTLQSLTKTHGALGAGVQPLVRQLGHDRGLALAAGVLVGVVCLTVAWRSRNELVAFAWSLGGALAFAPVVWLHYYALLAVPLAVARPRVGGAWWLYLALWVSWALSPLEWASAELSLAVLVLALLVLLSVRQPGRPSKRRSGAGASDSSGRTVDPRSRSPRAEPSAS